MPTSGLPLDCFCPQTRTQTLSPGPNGVEGAGRTPTAQISLSHPAQIYLHQLKGNQFIKHTKEKYFI